MDKEKERDVKAAHPSRRSFLIGGVALGASIALGIGLKSSVSDADVLRPPGSLAEGEFIARCIKCERCISICPTNILEPMGIEEGFVEVRSPRITFANNLCTFCDKCRSVCPTSAIGNVDPWNPREGRIGIAVVHPDRCIAFLEANSCGVCVEACPYEALSFDFDRRPLVDESKCNGCGECVRICPANVLLSFTGGSTRGIEVFTEKSFEKMKDTK
jgi:ferredoxin-type protein NapG